MGRFLTLLGLVGIGIGIYFTIIARRNPVAQNLNQAVQAGTNIDGDNGMIAFIGVGISLVVGIALKKKR